MTTLVVFLASWVGSAGSCKRLKRRRSESEERLLKAIRNIITVVAQSTVGIIQCQTINTHTGNVPTAFVESPVAGVVLQGSRTDIAMINQEALDDSERRTILEKKLAPKEHFLFPKNGQNRRYSPDWKKTTHAWLRYCPSHNGAHVSPLPSRIRVILNLSPNNSVTGKKACGRKGQL